MKWLYAFAIGVLVTAPCALAQTQLDDPDEAIKTYFWGDLYKNGGTSFFCRNKFDKKTVLYTESYVYGLNWVADSLRCGSQRSCGRDDETFRRIASDLHNIYPAKALVELRRRNTKYEALGPSVQPDDCGIRSAFQVIEPPDVVKGNVARAIAYMHTTYDLPMIMPVATLKEWNRLDPPDEEEKARNDKIRDIEGSENPYISNPSLIDNL
ncbi:endonuclease [Marinobacteraceae bacterium S3BR75-40.1]